MGNKISSGSFKHREKQNRLYYCHFKPTVVIKEMVTVSILMQTNNTFEKPFFNSKRRDDFDGVL